jgi:RHS repeat-associated protein
VAGQSFTYGFDGIGNRTASGGRASALSTYQPANRWNQLTSRTVAPAVDVIGTASPQSTVTVNRDGGTPLVTSRRGEYFHTAIAVPNTAAAYPKIGVTASGPGLPDTSGGKVYVPPAQESYTYDLDGNLTSDSRWKYRWDAENRLVEMTGNSDVAAAGNQRITFGYDAASRRISKRYTPAGSTNTTVTLFVHDGWNLVAELDGVTFVVQRTYAWGSDLSGSLTGAGGVGGLLWESVAGNGTHFVSYDGNGNVMGLNSATDGSNTARFEYGPFGEPIRASGPRAADGRIRFSSKYTDQESGLVYYGYRFYNAVTGRWISRDPIGEEGGLNLFEAVNNGPHNYIDRDGRDIFSLNPGGQNAPPANGSCEMYRNIGTDDCTAIDLGCQWLRGRSPSSRTISGLDTMANEMRQSPEAARARTALKQAMKSGCQKGMNAAFSRNLGAEGRANFYRGFVEDLLGRNRSRAFLGSFNGSATVTECWGCCAAVEFRIRNTAGWESASRLPPPFGYENPNAGAIFGSWPPNFKVGDVKSVLPNNCFGNYGRNVDITITWIETICPGSSLFSR